MSSTRLRLTQPLCAVVDRLAAATDDDPPFGFRLCAETGLGPGSMYPILERLAEIGWVETWWETGQPSGRPRRRYYRLTGAARIEYAAARDARDARRQRWTRLVPQADQTRENPA